MTEVEKLRLWISDREEKIFTTAELSELLAQYPNDTVEDRIQKARADALEIIASDIQKWTSYSVGGQSETFSKAEIMEIAAKIKRRYGFLGGRL